METQSSYYDILSISPRATDAEVKHAYRTLALKFHPDQNPRNRSAAQKRFQQISEAYAALKTREKRALYNQKLRKALKADNDNQNSFFRKLGGLWNTPSRKTAK